MFASLFIFPNSSSGAGRAGAILQALTLGLFALANATQAVAAPVCRPALAFRQVSFSPINLETMQRRWAATLSVDASRCATASGSFEILFTLWSETAFDDDFVRAFVWTPGLTEISVDVTANEAIGGYWLQGIGPCPCRE
jgi:hypothetical protein